MTTYTPTHVGTVTKYVVVESFDVTPADLAIRGYEISNGAMIKDTCFGLVVTGKPEEVERIVTGLRTMDPDHIFVKDRGFPPGDPRRCRANLGGARPGYHGMEFEMTVIPYITHGLEELKKRDATAVPAPKDPLDTSVLDVAILKKLIDAQES
ncbi:methanogenesis marker 6 protein [Methanoregula sp.]|uniref:methanogenesis marker 6 protein n=1 Tax=Methanoregula sp. TaxID=2052170 RepID=UPI002374783C|nr:methanogenesis marker 6 protein [Methanoregula sp.]MDD1686114.1 methanogenesis marker 6 protein [Methanoregula sp.]